MENRNENEPGGEGKRSYDVVKVHDIMDELLENFRKGLPTGFTTEWTENDPESENAEAVKSLDDIVRWDTGQMALISEISEENMPGVVEVSDFAEELIVRLCKSTGWKAAHLMTEDFPVENLLAKLAEKYTGKLFPYQPQDKDKVYMEKEEWDEAFSWLTENARLVKTEENRRGIDDLLGLADKMVELYGIRVIVVYAGDFIGDILGKGWLLDRWAIKIRNFGMRRDCLMVVVAHPRFVSADSDGYESGNSEMVLADGTDGFESIADYSLEVETDEVKGVRTVNVVKVRRKEFGDRGKFRYKTK